MTHERSKLGTRSPYTLNGTAMGYLSPASTSRFPPWASSASAQKARGPSRSISSVHHKHQPRITYRRPRPSRPDSYLATCLRVPTSSPVVHALLLCSFHSIQPSALHPWPRHQLSSLPTPPRPRTRPGTATGCCSPGGSSRTSSRPAASSPLGFSLSGSRAAPSPPSKRPRRRVPRRPRRSPRSTAWRSASGKYSAPRRRKGARKGKGGRRSRGPTKPRSSWPSTAARTWPPPSRSPSSPSPPATSSSTPASTSSSCSARLVSSRTRPEGRSGRSRWPTRRTRRRLRSGSRPRWR